MFAAALQGEATKQAQAQHTEANQVVPQTAAIPAGGGLQGGLKIVALMVVGSVAYVGYLLVKETATPVVRGDALPRAAVSAPPENAERLAMYRAEERVINDKMAAIWSTYDAEPPARRNKTRLSAAMDEATILVASAPTRLKLQLGAAALMSSRKRMAPLIRPESYATGEHLDVLVPADDAAKCIVWGGMWANSIADDLSRMGFVKIACPSEAREWQL
jgi:hypothetical protein